jgi:hypothetical protein
MGSEKLPVPHPTAPAEPAVATLQPSAGGDLAFYRERLVLATEYGEGPLPSGRELKRYREADLSAPRIILEEFRAESRPPSARRANPSKFQEP